MERKYRKDNFYKPIPYDIVEQFIGQRSVFDSTRHGTKKNDSSEISKSWRIRDRMKTVSVALVACLNVGVDPPDVFKITPCARLECWIDPSSLSPQKALELIGANLQKQYERWQPRARYKQSLDPTVEDVKKLCISLRRNAKEERVLFHYNGHGVPRPTINGEIWVFNRTYTQYIPLSIYDLQTWMGSPSIYVYDCSSAGIIVKSFSQFAEQHEREMEQMSSAGSHSSPSTTTPAYSYRNCIQLAACGEDQILPMNPQLPADLFTACLTTPIKIALKWFMLQRTSLLVPHLTQELIDRIPGQLNDRRTMLGELNWIFTAITDTIAWNTLPRDLFQRLFRQDLLVASLFRNFLLAERIMRSYDCSPVSSPQIPNGYRHHMWGAWDLAIDLALQQLPDIVERGAVYQNSPFFEDQLTAFHVWLERGSEERDPPEQLPIVLQVLLSQVHRLRALELLGKFLDLGPWAVNLALSVGIFPYVLKLLQASAKELRPLLVFIWAKILAVDVTCQVDLVLDQGQKYFLSVLQDPTITPKYRTLATFVLASIVHNFPQGQANALQGSLVSICLVQICDECHTLRQWLAICLGHLWKNYDKARWSGVRDLAHEKLYPLLQDTVPEVRAAAVYALGTFISSQHKDRTEHANNIDRSIALTLFSTVGNDMSPIVRMELLAALQWIVMLFLNLFISASLQDSSFPHGFNNTHSLERNVNIKRVSSSSSILNISGSGSLSNFSTTTIGFGSIYMKLWRGLLTFCHDPCPEVAQMAQKIVLYIIVDLNSAKEADKEIYGSSYSLPPSPNTRVNYLGGTSPPPHSQLNSLSKVHHPSEVSKPYAGVLERTASRSTTPVMDRSHLPRSRKNSKIHTSESDGAETVSASAIGSSGTPDMNVSTESQDQAKPNPIVTTNYIAWSTSNVTNTGPRSEGAFSMRYKSYAQKVRDIEYTVQNGVSTLYLTQSWCGRTQYIPNLIKFHPIEEQIAVAYKDKVMVNDRNTSHVQSYAPVHVPSTIPVLSARSHHHAEVTSFEFINPSSRTLLLVGYDDGCVRVWRPPSDTHEKATLITGWQAFNDVNVNRFTNTCGLITTYQSQNNVVVTGSIGKHIRFWDVETEKRVADTPTDTESAVRVLTSTNDGLTVAGFDDGCVRVIDKRCQPAYSVIRTYREHTDAILECCLVNEYSTMITGCKNGECFYSDFRMNRVIEHWKTGREATAMSAYPYSNIIAIGSESTISLYHYSGQELNRTRGNDGYRGTRNVHISCLSFHPLKGTIATGYSDNVVTAYDINDKVTRPISYYW